MVEYPNLIPIKEIAGLLNADQCLVRQMVEDKQIRGFATNNPNRRTFKIPRMAFYKDMGWHTDEEILNGYKQAGMLSILKKVTGANSD